MENKINFMPPFPTSRLLNNQSSLGRARGEQRVRFEVVSFGVS
jgi:hypothetical protein